MYKKFLLIIVLAFLGCDENPTKPQVNDSPEIKSIRIQKNWNLADSAGVYTIEVAVEDKQGFDDLYSVLLQVENETGMIIFSDSFYDDGGLNQTTDVIAGDGVFNNVFGVSEISALVGTYSFLFFISDTYGNSDSASAHVSFAFNSAPTISNLVAPDSLLGSESYQIISVTANDIDGDYQNISVSMDLLFNGLSILPEPYILENDGNTLINGDAFADDSIFSFKMDTSFAAGRIGRYALQIKATDLFADESTIISHDIYLENRAPEVFDLAAPDTLQKPSDSQTLNTALITLNVKDPQSLADIDSVFFISIKPDLTPASGNPFVLLDNGIPFDLNNFEVARGDEVAGDGKFSITILLDNTALTGTYEFTFYARDKVGNVSQMQQHLIEVQ